MTIDYKSTVYLPKTDFPMKAGLPKLEPLLLERWGKNNLDDQINRAGKLMIYCRFGAYGVNGGFRFFIVCRLL